MNSFLLAIYGMTYSYVQISWHFHTSQAIVTFLISLSHRLFSIMDTFKFLGGFGTSPVLGENKKEA